MARCLASSSSLVVVVPVCVGEAHSSHSSTNCSLAQMVAAGWVCASCFTFVNAPPTLLPFIKCLGVEPGYEGELKTSAWRWHAFVRREWLVPFEHERASGGARHLDDPLPDPTPSKRS